MTKMKGGSTCGAGSAAGYGTSVRGDASEQSAFISSQANGPANPNASLLPFKMGGGRRRRGRKRRSSRKYGGSTLVDVAVPAALMYANQMYRPKGAHVSFRRGHGKSRVSRKRRGSRRR